MAHGFPRPQERPHRPRPQQGDPVLASVLRKPHHDPSGREGTQEVERDNGVLSLYTVGSPGHPVPPRHCLCQQTLASACPATAALGLWLKRGGRRAGSFVQDQERGSGCSKKQVRRLRLCCAALVSDPRANSCEPVSPAFQAPRVQTGKTGSVLQLPRQGTSSLHFLHLSSCEAPQGAGEGARRPLTPAPPCGIGGQRGRSPRECRAGPGRSWPPRIALHRSQRTPL